MSWPSKDLQLTRKQDRKRAWVQAHSTPPPRGGGLQVVLRSQPPFTRPKPLL